MFSFLSSATPFFPFLLSSQFFQQTRAKRPASLHHFDFWFIFSGVSLGHSQKKLVPLAISILEPQLLAFLVVVKSLAVSYFP